VYRFYGPQCTSTSDINGSIAKHNINAIG